MGSFAHTGGGAFREIALQHQPGDVGIEDAPRSRQHVSAGRQHRQGSHVARGGGLNELRRIGGQQQAIDGAAVEQFERIGGHVGPARGNPIGRLRHGRRQEGKNREKGSEA